MNENIEKIKLELSRTDELFQLQVAEFDKQIEILKTKRDAWVSCYHIFGQTAANLKIPVETLADDLIKPRSPILT